MLYKKLLLYIYISLSLLSQLQDLYAMTAEFQSMDLLDEGDGFLLLMEMGFSHIKKELEAGQSRCITIIMYLCLAVFLSNLCIGHA